MASVFRSFLWIVVAMCSGAYAVHNSKIKNGLYVFIAEADYAAKDKFLSAEYMQKEPEENVYIYAEGVFRSLAGPQTGKSSGLLKPYREYMPCPKSKEHFCLNPKYSRADEYLVMEPGSGPGELKVTNHIKAGNQKHVFYLVRITDANLAAQFIDRMSVLAMYKSLSMKDLGYVLPLPQSGESVTVTSNLTLRAGPAKTTKSLGGLKKGIQVTVIEVTSNREVIDGIEAAWLKVKTNEGKEGYVFGGYVRK